MFPCLAGIHPQDRCMGELEEGAARRLRNGFRDNLAGSMSAPSEAGEHGQVAIKVIDERGNELLIVKPMSEAM